MRIVAAALGLWLASCAAPEPPPAPTTPEPEPEPIAETVAEKTVLGARISVTLLGDPGGTALAAAWAEADRVAELSADSPERAALASTARHVGEQLAVDVNPALFSDQLHLAYAVDRVADRLTAEGVGDFLVFGGAVARAGGSRDGGHGWHLGLAGHDPDRSDGTLTLRDQAIHTSRVEGSWANALGGSAVLATAAAELAARATGPAAPTAGRATAASIALRVGGDGPSAVSSQPWGAAFGR